jgi:hypothetical protein
MRGAIMKGMRKAWRKSPWYLLIYDSLTPEDGSAVSILPASSKQPLKDNLWNRSFCGHQGGRTYAENLMWKIAGSVNGGCKALKYLTQSFFNKSRKTQSKRRSDSASYASGTSASSTDTVKQPKSDLFKEVYHEERDGDRSAMGGWDSESTDPTGNRDRMRDGTVKRQGTIFDFPDSVLAS